MSSKLFEEAIADAKKLREVAEDNAKKAILEAVTPRIREFIEDQLLEGYKQDEGDLSDSEPNEGESVFEKEKGEDEEEVVLDESALLSLVELVGGEDMLKEFGLDSSIMQESVNKTFNSLSNVNQRKLQQIADKLNKKADLLESRRIDNNKGLNEWKRQVLKMLTITKQQKKNHQTKWLTL